MRPRHPMHHAQNSPSLLALALAAAVALAVPGAAAAQDAVTVRGEVGQSVSFALEDGSYEIDGVNGGNGDGTIEWRAGQVALNRTHYRLEFERRFGYDAAGLIAFKGHFDAGVGILDQLAQAGDSEIPSFVALDQAYVDLYSDSTDFRLGRQKIAWGTADGINPTSYFAPLGLDLTAGGLDGLIQPVTALRSSTYFNVGTLSAVVVPTFERRSDKAIQDALPEGITLEEDGIELPPNQGEFGLQFDTFFRGNSLYLSYFNGYEDQPVVWEDGDPDNNATWRRQQSLGLAAATTWRGFTLWAEGTYTFPESIDDLVAGIDPDHVYGPLDPYLRAVAGGDYRFANGLRLELQYLYNGPGSILKTYQPSTAPAGQYLMALASLPLGEAHTVELLALDSLNDDSVVWMPTYRYRLTPTTEARLGVLVVQGGPESEVREANLTQADQLTLGVTVQF